MMMMMMMIWPYRPRKAPLPRAHAASILMNFDQNVAEK